MNQLQRYILQYILKVLLFLNTYVDIINIIQNKINPSSQYKCYNNF